MSNETTELSSTSTAMLIKIAALQAETVRIAYRSVVEDILPSYHGQEEYFISSEELQEMKYGYKRVESMALKARCRAMHIFRVITPYSEPQTVNNDGSIPVSSSFEERSIQTYPRLAALEVYLQHIKHYHDVVGELKKRDVTDIVVAARKELRDV